ncbi:MAG: ATP-binding cassette domain-containing protein [Alphaproteobacteria bacterium]|nr:ATP-binding cassette domain-containing protein [Alphaproteobacteria bacterium]
MTEREVVVSIRGLEKSFGTNVVLRGVDLDLYRAENLVILGRSGTGKSVLIKILVGLIEPDAGTVVVLGQDVHALKRRELDALRVRLGFAFQHAALYDSMTVEENLGFPLRMNHPKMPEAEVRERIDDVLEAVGLPQTRHQMPSELSGGQRKRIGIARTLILRPEIMLYDEPTAGLDPSTCGEINDLILQVRERYRTSAIVITHDLTCARATGDRIGVLVEGQLLVVGTFDEVFANPDPRIQAFYDYNFIQGARA